jgi:signal transduction histidine kinase/CheY-like chemotaxis protein
VLTPAHQTRAAGHELLKAAGQITLVPRPVEIQALARTVQSSLRDRRRQYEVRDAIADREAQAQALLEADRQKNEFLAIVAHELRNPLAGVNNAVTVLKMSSDEESRNWASDVVERQVRQLVRLIDDLLDVSRITSGKIRLNKEYVDAGPILDQAVESVRPLIDQRQQTLSVSIERGQLPLYVDATRVEQIVLNLLTNASKFTGSGGQIWLSARQDGHQAIIGVRDNGIGIAPEKLPEMFRLFSQGDQSLERAQGGLGIGLTMVQKLTEMHGGSVKARSEGPGQGSEFVVRFPLAPPPADVQAITPPRELPKDQGARILVVEDNVDAARGMVQLLKLLGNEVMAVHDGRAAIDAARDFRPDFVLLDIALPGLDGYQVAATLRGDEIHRDTVLIAVSGYAQEEDRQRALDAGFDHHLVKPVDFDSLISLLDRSS